LHSDIKFVRTPRTAGKKNKVDASQSFTYAFIEFSTEEETNKAKNKLATSRFKGSELYVDFVGKKSKSAKKEVKGERLNPTRLFICGLAPGVTKGALKEMFPKCCGADIPSNSAKKGTPFGFVQFSNPGDAKSAFDAAKDLDIAGHKISVFYAKISEDKDKILAQKDKKRKKNEEKKKKLKEKKAKLAFVNGESASDSDDEEDDEEVKLSKSTIETEDGNDDTVEQDDDNDDDDDEEEDDDEAEAEGGDDDGDDNDDDDDDDDDDDEEDDE